MTSPWHSGKEIEHRLTSIEVMQSERAEANESRWDETDDIIQAIQSRMAWHERAILAILGCLQIVLQDKYPGLADILKGLMK